MVPVVTAMVLGEVGDVARFRTRHHFASYNASAPDDKGSAGSPACAVNLKGNRRLNHAVQIVAVTRIAHDCSGRRYYERKLAEGKTKKETLRALKRRISDAIYRQLVADTKRQVGPVGSRGRLLKPA